MSLRSLIKDTAVYGASSIVGRLLNWLLVPMYTYTFTQTGEYGIVTNLYSWVAVALILLTYGMETGFFRFVNHERWSDPGEVYTTSVISIGTTSAVFLAVVVPLSGYIAVALDYGEHGSYIWMMAVAVALDAVTSIPFSFLRYKKKAWRFAGVKLLGIGLNILLNLLFIVWCPWLMQHCPGTVDWFYDPTMGIGYIFMANMICSGVTLLLLLPELTAVPYRFNGKLLREMLVYSLPLLVLGLAGIMNQTIDKILLPVLEPDKARAMADLGVYGACYKVAVIMVMFLQAFRFAYEPYVFARNREADPRERLDEYSRVMTWFVAFGFLIFLAVMEMLPLLKYFIGPHYYVGLKVVKYIMLGELFFGIFFNLSIWYKLTDRTVWGSYFSLGGLAVTVGLNILLVPRIGYMGCAIAALVCYATMMIASYVVGRRYLPVPYKLGRLALYACMGLGLYGLGCVASTGNTPTDLCTGVALIIIYIAVFKRMELPGLRLKELLRRH